MRRVAIATCLLLLASAAVHAGDAKQKSGRLHHQKDATQKREATHSHRAEQKSTKTGKLVDDYGKGKDAGKGGHHCRFCDKHRCWFHRAEAPRAPVMGSAPAMMAPVVLVQSEHRALPASDQKAEDEIERLKKILEALDDLIPQQPAAAPAQSPEAKALEQITQTLKEQQETQKVLVKSLDAMLKRLAEVEGRLERQQRDEAEDSDAESPDPPVSSDAP